MNLAPYHTGTIQFPAVYHNNPECPDGRHIKHKHRFGGTAGRRLCKWCAAAERKAAILSENPRDLVGNVEDAL